MAMHKMIISDVDVQVIKKFTLNENSIFKQTKKSTNGFMWSCLNCQFYEYYIGLLLKALSLYTILRRLFFLLN